MELLKKVLLSISLIFIIARNAISNNSLNEVDRINKESIRLIHYHINLTLYINKNDYKNIKNTIIYETFKSYIDEQRAKGNFIFYGESIMFFYFLNKSNKILLHTRNLKINETAIEFFFTYGDVNLIQTPKMHIYDNETIVIYINNFQPELYHTYRLIMKFVGSITDNTGGFFRISYINNKGEKMWLMAAADFQGAGARQIFPCWDEPAIRSNFTISIRHHQYYKVLSNAPMIDNFTDDNGMVKTHFETTDKISPYLVAVVLSDLDRVSDTNMWCRQHVEQQIKFAQEVAINATFYLSNIFDTRIPSKMDYVVIPGFRDEGVESWGLVLYRETAVIYDENLDFIAWKFEVARTVTRKIVHQYFGNLVGPSWWSYLWFNEGIAMFLAMNIVSKSVHFQLNDLLAVQFQHESLRLNDYYDMPLVSKINTISDINSLFSFIYYVKAPVFIRTLLQIVPLYMFEASLNTYLTSSDRHESNDTSNTIDIFFNILQKNLEDQYGPNIKLTERFIFWTKQERYPVLLVIRECCGNKFNISTTLAQKDSNKSYPKNLWIHITYTTQSAFYITTKKWLSPYKPILHLTDIRIDDWIIVNVQQAGYYRVNYDNDNWEKLVKYLNSKEYLKIHVLNRAQIIDDAYYFLSMKKLDFHFFRRLTYYLSNETDYVVWYPMFKILEYLSGFFPFQQSIKVKKHFQEILTSVYKMKYLDNNYLDSEENDFIKCLKQEVSKWACTLNSLECTTYAVSSLKNWIFYKKPKLILPGWKEWTYCKGMILATNDIWNKVLNAEVLDNKLLEFLACSKNHTIIISYIDRLMSEYFTQAQHCITIFHSIIAKHAENNFVLDYILQNFEQVVPSEIKSTVALVDIINYLYSVEQLMKIIVFMQNLPSDIFSLVYKKIEIRLHQVDRHVNYFESFLKT